MRSIDLCCGFGRGLAGVLALTGVLAGCSAEPDAEPELALAADAESAEAPAEGPRLPVGPATDLPPNELGEIMVLEYHRLGTPEGEFRRSLANFRADLQRLYEGGYRPVTVKQLVAGDLDVPRGTTPVVFTFDDSSEGQFYLLEDGSIDPNTMLGVWEAFRRENPGWDGGATWCVLPGADYPSNFFGERPRTEVPREERERRIRFKVDYLLDQGHEICNHTLYHARLDRAVDDRQVQEWIGRGRDSIHVYLPPDYEITTLALPLGMWPRNRVLALSGEHAGKRYEHTAVLEVTGGPTESPFDREFDRFSIERVIVAPNHLERLLEAYDRNPGRRYISDGDLRYITVPASEASRVDGNRWPDREIRALEQTTAPVAPPSVADTAAPPPGGRPARPAGEGT